MPLIHNDEEYQRKQAEAITLREPDHVVCCHPFRALCGADVSGQGVLFGAPELSARPCQQCFNLAADGARCGEPMCPGGEE